MTPEEFRALMDGAKTEIVKQFDDKIAELKKDKTEDKTDEINELKTQLKTLSNKFDEMVSKGLSVESEDEGFISSFQKAFREVVKNNSMEQGKVNWGNVGKQEFDVVMKAVMTTTNSLNGSNLFFTTKELEKEIVRSPRNELSILDLISVYPTKASQINWRYLFSTTGTPAATAEGGAFPEVTKVWAEGSEKVKKISAYTDITEEDLEDTDFIEVELPQELRDDLRNVLELHVLSGTGSATELNGLNTIATTFARPAGVGQMSNVTRWDVLRVVLLQLAKSNFKGNAIVLNPTDIALMELQKDSTNNYIIPPFVTAEGMKVKGVMVVESNNMAEGNFLVGDFKKAKMKVKRELTFKIFTEDAQNAKLDQRTATISIRAALVVKHPHRSGFVKGVFSTAITALQAP
jgi:HK97 family phage major capsid protein